MLIHKNGDVFTTTLPAVAHGVNLKGVMGAGIAKTVRKLFPEVYRDYRAACFSNRFNVGEMLPLYSPGRNLWVFNVASQDLPGANARIDWLEESLMASAEFCMMKGLAGFAAPRIGAGIGGLVWEDVLAVFEKVAADYPSLTIELWTF